MRLSTSRRLVHGPSRLGRAHTANAHTHWPCAAQTRGQHELTRTRTRHIRPTSKTHGHERRPPNQAPAPPGPRVGQTATNQHTRRQPSMYSYAAGSRAALKSSILVPQRNGVLDLSLPAPALPRGLCGAKVDFAVVGQVRPLESIVRRTQAHDARAPAHANWSACAV